jgi:glycosyltransferase involved in cell wall biosynthesis
MKIVFIGGRDIHKLGGIENYMLNLTRELTKLGNECIVWCESDHHAVEDVNGVKVVYHPCPKSNLLCKPWGGLKATIATLLKERGVSVIHYNAWPPSLWNWIPRLVGIPALMEGHGLEWQRSKYSPRAQKVMKFMEKVTAKINNHLIMCSEAQVRYFKNEYGKDATCIPCAVNLPSENPASSDVLARFGITSGKYFLFLARLVQDKNPDYLIQAFIRAKHDGYQLVIAGDNEAMPEYVEKLHSMARSCADIIFTGAVYGADKDILLRNAYCYCIPSTIEGLAIGLLEALSYKLPVIASDIEANQEVLSRDDALWCKAEDEDSLVEALENAILSPEILSGFTERNYSRLCRQYTWDKVADKYITYLHRIGIE